MGYQRGNYNRVSIKICYNEKMDLKNWNLSGLILEGVCGTGKTSILRAILHSKAYLQKPYLTSLVLSEHQTQRVLESKERQGTLTLADNLALLEQHVAYLEGLQKWLEEMEWCDQNIVAMRIPYLIERFHFTHVGNYDFIHWEDVAPLDRRLAKCNCRLCLFTIDEATLEQRVIHDRNPGWREYIRQFGATNAEIVRHYSEQQEEMVRLCRQSALESRLIDTSHRSLQDTVDEVLDFWGALV